MSNFVHTKNSFLPYDLFLSIEMGALLLLVPVYSSPRDDDPNALPKKITPTELNRLLSDWEKSTKERMSKEPALKELLAKYPLVVLHSRRYVTGGGYGKSAYSFIHETTEETKHGNRVQLLFDNGSGLNTCEIRMSVDDQNLIADLGAVDFTKNPDVKKISLDGYGINSWDPKNKKAIEGHVYVERVRDKKGNKFYVLFKIVAVDKASRYVAFVWRILPGAKIVKAP